MAFILSLGASAGVTEFTSTNPVQFYWNSSLVPYFQVRNYRLWQWVAVDSEDGYWAKIMDVGDGLTFTYNQTVPIAFYAVTANNETNWSRISNVISVRITP